MAAWHRARFQHDKGVVFIGIAQEKATSFKAAKQVSAAGSAHAVSIWQAEVSLTQVWLGRLYAHLFRHSIAQRAAREAAKVGEIQTMLGHPTQALARRHAGEALWRVGVILDRLKLTLPPTKTQVVFVGGGQQGFDFLGFPCRKVESWKYRGRRYPQRWPSQRALQRVRDRVTAITAPGTAYRSRSSRSWRK